MIAKFIFSVPIITESFLVFFVFSGHCRMGKNAEYLKTENSKNIKQDNIHNIFFIDLQGTVHYFLNLVVQNDRQKLTTLYLQQLLIWCILKDIWDFENLEKI